MLGERSALKELAEGLVAVERRYLYDNGREENPSGFIVDTLRAVFQSLFAANSFETALVDVVNRGGDSDTTGAILGMIAGALYGADAIPRRWLSALNREVAAVCVEQATALVRLSPLVRGSSGAIACP